MNVDFSYASVVFVFSILYAITAKGLYAFILWHAKKRAPNRRTMFDPENYLIHQQEIHSKVLTSRYAEYVSKYYSDNAIIVFDDIHKVPNFWVCLLIDYFHLYGDTSNKTIIATISRRMFLSEERQKSRIISMPCTRDELDCDE